MYIAWGVFYEGPSDAAYFDVLIPRIIEELLQKYARRAVDFSPTPTVIFGRYGRSVEKVVPEICAARDAIHIAFIHADTGGRALETTMEARSDAYCLRAQAECGFQEEFCICIRVRHETEAWALADPEAVRSALGFKGQLLIPENARAAERLTDPKAVLHEAVKHARGRRVQNRDVSRLLPIIAQNQKLEAMLASASFHAFHSDTERALVSLRAIETSNP